MIVTDPRSTWSYVLEAERALSKDQQTTFRLRHLSLAAESELIDSYARDPMTGLMIRQAIGSEHLRVLRRALVGWDNLCKPDGSPVVFEAGPQGGAKDELLALIPLLVREELARAVEAETLQPEAERGKSSLPSTPATAAT
jgi:hypothetical protein